ncbi:MAG TPA: galactokinase [Candidatus Aphodoplasma excrementigallinarum]|uniref:Galactokinase n=1 Tax=Candidatus Aphodoplasma excrementigallinarum TaxID=2840673 RepID=A0A9D1SZL3_9FIRM|nr:galactokinase [Candidatus Aphodoplasma excrementigallinarum]
MQNFTIEELKQQFIDIYGGSRDDLRVFMAPGRVNLIGEHTDYNGGYVFPAALTMNTTVVARKRDDNLIHLCATDLPDRVEADITKLDSYKHLKWGNYQIGVAYELEKLGYEIVGCDMLSHGTIPYGGGLSSSASIEVSTAILFATFSNEKKGLPNDIDMIEMAKVSQRTEHTYAGVNCGIMDQFASAMGKKDHAIFLNCKNLDYSLVPLKMDGYKLVIANTNKKRGLADSKYNERRSECEAAFELLKDAVPGATCLGDISAGQFAANAHLIENETVRKRAQHVIEEDDRVLRSVEALKAGDLTTFGALMTQSHNSLRDLYEVTGVELDTLVEEALKIDGTIGSRMTGAGFGGCSVSLVREDAVERFIETVGKEYEKKIGYAASFYVSDIGDGGMELK